MSTFTRIRNLSFVLDAVQFLWRRYVSKKQPPIPSGDAWEVTPFDFKIDWLLQDQRNEPSASASKQDVKPDTAGNLSRPKRPAAQYSFPDTEKFVDRGVLIPPFRHAWETTKSGEDASAGGKT